MFKAPFAPCLAAPVATIAMAAAAHAQIAIQDDFDDGDDAGWVRINGVGLASYLFPSGGYRILASQSPDPGMFGPARGGSVRQDTTLTDFVISVDILDWDASATAQIFGILARSAGTAPGMVDGYILGHDVGSTLDIARIDGEVPNELATIPLELVPGNDYRMVFEGRGNQFTGSVFDLANLAAPIVSLTVDDPDSRYAGGNPGLFVFDNSDLGDGTGDVTFDNFAAGPVPEPAGAALLALAGTAFLVRRRRLATA